MPLTADGSGSAIIFLIGNLFEKLKRTKEAVQAYRESVTRARAMRELEVERLSLRGLLRISDAGRRLPDASALRARLAELDAAAPT